MLQLTIPDGSYKLDQCVDRSFAPPESHEGEHFEREIKRVKGGRFVLLPASDQTHGHGTHTWAALWQQHLAQRMVSSEGIKDDVKDVEILESKIKGENSKGIKIMIKKNTYERT